MNETFIEFIARRRAELNTEEQVLREKLLTIQSEREALRAAEDKLKHQAGTLIPIGVPKERRPPRVIRPATIMADVIDILAQRPDGMIALDILRELNNQRDQPIDRTSLSPQLSRLKKAGIVGLDGSRWYYIKKTGPDAYASEP